MTDDWKDQHGALIGARDGNPESVAAAFALALGDLGYRLRETTDPVASLALQRFACERGAWICARMDRGTARGLAARLAARTGETVWLLVARATFRENVKPACLFDASEATVTPEGRFGVAPSAVLEELSYSERELDTDHPWRLVEQALDLGIDAWMGKHRQDTSSEWIAPTPLANARLEGLARQIRAGAQVERVQVTNRPALRVRAIDGTVSTAFLSADELAALVDACPRLASV